MSRAKSPKLVMSDWRNYTGYYVDGFGDFTKEQEADLIRLFLDGAEDQAIAIIAVKNAIRSACHEFLTPRPTQAEYKAVFNQMAKAAGEVHDHIMAWHFFGQLFETNRFPEIFDDPLFAEFRKLRDLAGLMAARANQRAEEIDTKNFIRNPAHHVLAEKLLLAVRDGALPISPSASKSGRLADLFDWCTQVAEIGPADAETYLTGK